MTAEQYTAVIDTLILLWIAGSDIYARMRSVK